MSDVAGWQNFYLMTGGAAAALTGLIFVALSLQTKAIMAHPLHRDRAFASIQLLLAQLFISAAILVPDQPSWALGLEIALIAAWFVIRTFRALGLIQSVGSLAWGRRTSLWIVESTFWFVWLIPLVASGPLVIAGVAAGLYLLAFAMVLMFGYNVYNAWVLIAENAG